LRSEDIGIKIGNMKLVAHAQNNLQQRCKETLRS